MDHSLEMGASKNWRGVSSWALGFISQRGTDISHGGLTGTLLEPLLDVGVVLGLMNLEGSRVDICLGLEGFRVRCKVTASIPPLS